ncbi:uncharacterized protein [Nicotiana tomentosiformis]|uniref:uncharacterized protein n=1 Tax=Nicotiana tomentosiformis TaxID=4098 RepID=UPI00388CDCA7
MARQVHRGASASHGSYNARLVKSSLSALPAQSSSRAPSVQGSSAPGSSSSYSGYRGPIKSPPSLTDWSCYECGELGHIRSQCPHLLGDPVQQRGQAMTSSPVTSPPAQRARGGAQAVRGRPRAGGRSGGGEARFYAIPARLENVTSDTMITGIASVFNWDASILFDPGSTYLYLSSYFACYLDMPLESLVSPTHVSTLVGDTIIVDRVYRSCVVIIGGLETRVDLLLPNMVDFDIIFGMDWLSPCHAILCCHAKTVTLVMPRLPTIKWRGSLVYVPSRVISYLKAQQMVGKGCLSYLAFVRDVGADTPTIDSVSVVLDFSDVFPTDLSDMQPNRDIDFGIDLVRGTQPISIPPYPMAPTELKELKE